MSASGVQCGSMSGQFVGHIGAFHCPERNFFANEINECDLRGTIRRTLEDFFGRLQTFGEPMYWTILPKLAERAGQCRTIRRTLGHIGPFFRNWPNARVNIGQFVGHWGTARANVGQFVGHWGTAKKVSFHAGFTHSEPLQNSNGPKNGSHYDRLSWECMRSAKVCSFV